jgi:hypothetical protein
MTLFETQINDALVGYPGVLGEDDSRPGTPDDSILESPLSRLTALGRSGRPETRDSNRSTMSKLTSESTMSVLAAVRGAPPSSHRKKRERPGTASTSGRTNGDEKVDAISQRIASIQIKASRI